MLGSALSSKNIGDGRLNVAPSGKKKERKAMGAPTY